MSSAILIITGLDYGTGKSLIPGFGWIYSQFRPAARQRRSTSWGRPAGWPYRGGQNAPVVPFLTKNPSHKIISGDPETVSGIVDFILGITKIVLANTVLISGFVFFVLGVAKIISAIAAVPALP